jgi:glycosyltransferase involved in cell wall biosynthesis
MYTQAISRRLLERGHQCHVLAGTRQAREGVIELDDGVHVTRLAGVGRKAGGWFPAYDPEIEDRVRGYLDDLKPDVVHIHHWVSLTANLVALCSEMDLPTIVTLHDLAVICPRGDRIRFDKVFCTDPLSTAPCLICVEREPWQKDHEVQEELALRQQMIREGLHLADRLLVPSQVQKDFLAGFLDVPVDRLEVLPHGTLHDLRPVGGSAEATSQRPLRIGHWGHLIWQKGPHLLLEAVRHLSDPRAVEVHLMGEAGDPAYQQELHALAQDLTVTFHGAFTPTDLTKLDLDVAVFPGLFHESHSFVLDEAFQLGLPVVVSSRGAPAERVGSVGLVFSAGVVGDLVAKIAMLLAEPALLEQLRRGTPKDPPHPMSEHIIALEGIYQKVTRSRGKKSVSRPNYLKLLILRQHQLAEREAAIAREQIRYQQLQTQAQEYQGHVDRELAKAQAEYQQLQTQAQEYQGHLEQQIKNLSQERDQLRKALDKVLAHSAVRLYLRAEEFLLRRPRGG